MPALTHGVPYVPDPYPKMVGDKMVQDHREHSKLVGHEIGPDGLPVVKQGESKVKQGESEPLPEVVHATKLKTATAEVVAEKPHSKPPEKHEKPEVKHK